MHKTMIFVSKNGAISKSNSILLFIIILLYVPPQPVGGFERTGIYELSHDDDVSYHDVSRKKASLEGDNSL